MSIRVNLLPEATRERSRAGRQRQLFAAVALVVLAGLAFVYNVHARELGAAETELTAAEAELAELQAREAELAPYTELDTRLADAHERLTTAMADEVSFAGILQNVAAVTPTDTGLTNLTLNVDVAEPGAPDAETEPASPLVGTFNITGHSVAGHAPGVERILLQLAKISDFSEPYFNSSTVDEDDVATFNLDVGLLPTARTLRYAEGLPEVLQ